MTRRIDDVNKGIANKLGTWHLDQWEEFVRLSADEQRVWEHICRHGAKLKAGWQPQRRGKRVICITTGKEYNTIIEAAIDMKCKRHTLKLSIDKQRPLLGRFYFQFLED